jgi:hypothetical protein
VASSEVDRRPACGERRARPAAFEVGTGRFALAFVVFEPRVRLEAWRGVIVVETER